MKYLQITCPIPSSCTRSWYHPIYHSYKHINHLVTLSPNRNILINLFPCLLHAADSILLIYLRKVILALLLICGYLHSMLQICQETILFLVPINCQILIFKICVTYNNLLLCRFFFILHFLILEVLLVIYGLINTGYWHTIKNSTLINTCR